MTDPLPVDSSILKRLIAGVLGDRQASAILSVLEVDARLSGGGDIATRGQLAMALNAILLSNLLNEVPTAAAYVDGLRAAGKRLCFDHGALRTIKGDTGALPSGHTAFARILEPLGYEMAGLYPLPKLHMTGRGFTHRDFPESVPQFFVSELHMAELPEAARAAGRRVFGCSRDPLDTGAMEALDLLRREQTCPLDGALYLLRKMAAAFGPQHSVPSLGDYETLRAHTAEGAWMATEGNAFNHATHRVADVAALAEELRDQGFPLKPEIEISANGRIRQTAFIADRVMRPFRDENDCLVKREVPGSFFEFISRDVDPATGRIDLSFDSGNATGIFAVTRGL